MAGLGIGLIGSGYMGKCHALAWNAVASVFGDIERPRLLMLAEANAPLAEEKARQLGFSRSTGDWRALVCDPEVDVVSITTPNAFHAEMAVVALEAGKHVWCEKPMAPDFADAARMAAAARRSGKVAAMGYNYIQNPAIRHMGRLIAEGAIGTVNHVRLEMDEDFMADASAPFSLRSSASSGYGALDDFGVHTLSLLSVLAGPVRRVVAQAAKPYADRPGPDGPRAVENHDIANVLMELHGGASAVLMVNRAAWGRKGRIAIQIFGSRGSMLYDQERLNEFELYQADGGAQAGYRRILSGPAHPPYGQFVPAPGHGLGFNDLKVIECHEVIHAISGRKAHLIDFDQGLQIERAVHAMARSARDGGWVAVDSDPA